MIVGYDFMMDTDSGVPPAKASMTLYQDDQLSWLSSPEHHVECQWIHPERNQLEVAALDTEPTGPANQEYGVMPEVASRVVADLGASDLALDAFSSGTSAHLRVCEKYFFFPTALAATHNVIIIVPLCMSHRHYRMYI